MFSQILYLFFVFVLLLTASYFSACETAITAYSRPKMFRLANDGNPKAKIILELQNDIGMVISSILTCNTIVNSLTVSFATVTCIDLLGPASMVYSPIIASLLIILFAEILPKMLAISNPEKILMPSAYFIKFIFVALRPLNNVLGTAAKKFINFIKFSSKEQDEASSALEELKGAIDLHKGTNIEDTAHEKEMLKSVLDLGTVPVSNIMVHRKNVTMFCVDDKVDILIDQIMNCPFTRIPLWSGNQDNIVGVLHVKDLLKEFKNNRGLDNIDIKSIALKPWFIPENKDLLDQLQAFKKKHEHFALVIDEYGSFMGIITLEDIIEEIVGDIADEHDIAATTGVRAQEDGSYIVDGSVNIRDLNREIGTNFKSEIAATIAGLVINSVGIIPEIGQIFVLFQHKFEILKKQRNQVTLIRITKIGDTKNENRE